MLSCGAGNFNFRGDVARATLTLDAQTAGVIRLPCRWARGRRELTGGRKAGREKNGRPVDDGTAARKAWAAVPAGSSTGGVFSVADDYRGLLKGRRSNQPSSQSWSASITMSASTELVSLAFATLRQAQQSLLIRRGVPSAALRTASRASSRNSG